MNEQINAYIKEYLINSIKEYVKIKLEENSILSDSQSTVRVMNDNLSMTFSHYVNCYDLHSKTTVYYEVVTWIINILDSLKQSALNHFSISKENDYLSFSYLDILINHLYCNKNDFIFNFLDINNLSLKELIEDKTISNKEIY